MGAWCPVHWNQRALCSGGAWQHLSAVLPVCPAVSLPNICKNRRCEPGCQGWTALEELRWFSKAYETTTQQLK